MKRATLGALPRVQAALIAIAPSAYEVVADCDELSRDTDENDRRALEYRR